VASIFGSIKERECELHSFFDLSLKESTLSAIQEAKDADLVMFSFTEPNWLQAKRFAARIKNVNSDCKIFVGGPFPTVAPEFLIEEDWIDMLCVGEGEYVVPEVLEDLERRDIQNVWYKEEDGTVIKNDVRPLGKIDDLPLLDRSIWPDNYIVDPKGCSMVMSGRGCPYKCTYCCNAAVRDVYKGKGGYYRERDLDDVVDEIDFLADVYGTKRFFFADETFTTHRKRAFRFCDKYEESEIGLPFGFMCRPESLTNELVERLKQVGCDTINMGVECANEELRSKYLNREMTNDEIIQAFDFCHNHGIESSSFCMIGVPGETEGTINELLRLNLRLKPKIFQVTILFPFHGSAIRKIYQDNGWLDDSLLNKYDDYDYYSQVITKLPGLSSERLVELKNSIVNTYKLKQPFLE